jgi:hypothetical protein
MKRASPKLVKSARDGHREELLDEALAQTFPASDPPAMLEPGIRQRKKRRKADRKPRSR